MFQHPPPRTSGFRDIGLRMEGGPGSLTIGSFLPVPMPDGFLATGGISQVGGFGFPDIGDAVDVKPLASQSVINVGAWDQCSPLNPLERYSERGP